MVSRYDSIFCPSIVVQSSILFALYSILFAYFNSRHDQWFFFARSDDNNNNTNLQSKRKRVNDGHIQGILIIWMTRDDYYYSSSHFLPVVIIFTISPDQNIARFWQSLDSATEDNGVLSLPADSFWMGDPALGSKLVIRQCYNDLWDMIQDLRTNQGIRRVALMGNPGIGKSWFLFYLLYKLKQLGATVVSDWKILQSAYRFSPTGTTSKGDQFQPELSLADTW